MVCRPAEGGERMIQDENGITAVFMRLLDDLKAERLRDAIDYFCGVDA